MDQLQSAFGLVVLLGIAWGLSENRRDKRHLRIALAGLGVQLVLALLLLKVPPVGRAFEALNDLVIALQTASEAGSSFVFGFLGGGPLPYEETRPGASFSLAFRALPLILVVSALSALLTYWRILPLIVRGFAFLLRRSLGVGGAVGLAAAANVFVGMVEAPLLVRPYLVRLGRAELFMVMVTGMATIAGTVLVLYATFLGPVLPDAAGHLVIASIISAPAAITIAKLMVPGAASEAATEAEFAPDPDTTSAMDAVTRGTAAGLQLYLNVVAMLIVLVALVQIVNMILGLLPDVAGEPLALERLLGWVMAPLVWLMGVPWAEAPTAGALMGVKTVLNELLAYLQLAKLPAEALSERSRLIMTYAICGFANFGSLGILIGGLATMVPERRAEIVALGFKSIVAGTLATMCTGAVVGIL
ncbi:MAG: nucleoside transporter C-terminal domain-containing protein [Alphaproteobacteria bacterium]|nr:nucleoside transporter C-terminal domain-containing protein [Alphaproteobacteria bacterium]